MSSHRFYLPPELCRADDLVLSGGEAHHALHVLRIPLGQRIIVLDGAGQEISCEVQHTTRDQVRLSVIEKKLVPPLPCHITLLQAVPKGKMIESIIQKATELSVSRIVPLLSERVVTQLNPVEARHKAEKWQTVAIEAIKQCGSPWLPRVETPLTPAQFLSREENFDLALAGSLQVDAAHPRKFFQSFRAEHGHKPASVAVWVGPEGDFTLSELHGIQAGGAKPITLGRLVLRSETAAIFCLSVINYELASPG